MLNPKKAIVIPNKMLTFAPKLWTNRLHIKYYMKYNEQYFNNQFDLLNEQYFDGGLEKAKIGLVYNKSILGTHQYKNGVHYICMSLYFIRTEKAYLTTLLHEMVHQYIKQNKIKDTSIHGREFKRIAARLQKHGWNIKVYNKGSEDLGIIGMYKPVDFVIATFTLPNGKRWVCRIAPSRVQYYINWFEMYPDYFKNPSIFKTQDVRFVHYPCCRKGTRGNQISIKELHDMVKTELIYKAQTLSIKHKAG